MQNKELDTIQCPFIIKTPQTKNKRKLIKPNKKESEKSLLTSYFMVEDCMFFLKIRNK